MTITDEKKTAASFEKEVDSEPIKMEFKATEGTVEP